MHSGERTGMVETSGVLDALAGLVWTARADGRCDFVNRGWHDYTGLGLDDARDHGWQTVIHPDDRPSFLAAWDVIRQAGTVDDIDARLRRFDGEYRWFALRPSPFPAGAQGDPSWCWLAIDIDEGPSTDGRMRRLLDRLPIQVAFLNLAGTSEYSNRKTLDDYGMTLDELVQWQTSGAIHPDDHPVVHEQLERLMTTGEMFDAQVRMHYKDGTYRWMRCLCVPFRDAQDNVVRYVTCQLDIDDRKRAEALLAAEVALLEMVARGETLPRVLDAVSRHVEDLCTDCHCSILVVAPDRKHFWVGAGPSLPDEYNRILDGKTIDAGYGPCSLAVVEKGPIITADLANDPRWEGSIWPPLMKTYGYASCWSMPILSISGEISAIFAIYRRQPVAPTAEEQELIDRFTKLTGIAIDRAQADAALQISEGELRAALAQLSEGQRLNKTGSFTADLTIDQHQWSDEYYRIFEIDPATPPRVQAVRDRVHPDDLALFDAEIQRGIEGHGADFTFRVVTPTAGLKYLRGVAHLIDTVAGRPIFMGTVQDITDSKLAEEALRASSAELRRINMQLTDAHRLSRTGSFTWDVLADDHAWTEEIYRLFEFDPDTKVDMRMMFEAIHPDDRQKVEQLVQQASEGTDFDLEFRVVPRSGSVKHARVVGRRVGLATDRPIFMGALQDVTSSKLAEDALNRARSELAHVTRAAALSALTASIGHEVNQPLSGILTNANTCLRMLAADPPNVVGASETARRTIRDANRAAEVIKRLRALFANKAPAMERIDLNEAARELIALSSSELQRGRVVLQTQFAGNLPIVEGDRIQLQQVMLNLLLNAADAMAEIEDRPRIVAVETAVGPEGDVKLLVRDSGIGVDPQIVHRLFDPFYTTKSQGMGVGLSISRTIIENHGGRIWAVPNDGPGATFGFSIPPAGGPAGTIG